jgi:hypothetical protein
MPVIELPPGQAEVAIILAVVGALACFFMLVWAVLARGRMVGAVLVFWLAFAGLIACLVLVLGIEVRGG